MHKKDNKIEMKIYELLGIKYFKKLIFFIYKKNKFFPFTIFMSKETRKKFYRTPSNYCMKRGHGLKDLMDFKKMLLLNAIIHIGVLFYRLVEVLSVINMGVNSIFAKYNICIF